MNKGNGGIKRGTDVSSLELNRSSFHAQSESVFLPPVDKFLFILLQCFLFRSFRIVLFSFSSSRNNQIVSIYPKIERSLDKKDFSPSIFLRFEEEEEENRASSSFAFKREAFSEFAEKWEGRGIRDMRATILSREHRGEQRTGYFVGPQNPSPFSPAQTKGGCTRSLFRTGCLSSINFNPSGQR